MKSVWCFVCGAIMLLTSSAAFAHGGQTPAGPPPAPVSLAEGMRRAWATIKTNVTQALDVMPEENFSFKTTPANKTFGAQFGHVANFHYNLCAAAKVCRIQTRKTSSRRQPGPTW